MTLEEFLEEWNNSSDKLLVHTSGSTGRPKPLWVEKRRMVASARITCNFLGLEQGDTALLCMPLDYIAGKMMVVRALTCALHLVSVQPSGHPLSDVSLNASSVPLNTAFTFAAMVPLQVYNSLQVPEERARLMRVKHLIIGGGAIDESLAAELRNFPNAVWSTYGMTETLSHIALRRLNGADASEWYTPFESIQVSLSDDGCLVIDAPEVCSELLVTNDRAELRNGQFRIIGRKDNVICSGGLKIQIEEVEKRLKPVLTAPFLITKRKDEKFGEAVVLLTEGSEQEAVQQVTKANMPKHWLPRYYVHVDHLPLTETGKPARKEAEQLAV